MQKKILVVILVILLFPNFVFSNVKEKEGKILILNSYSEYYSWSRNELDGVLDGINEKFPKTTIYIENMDTKRYSGVEYYHKIMKIYDFKYNSINFDAIITLDNSAFEFAIKNRENMFNDAPIFFSGINNIKNYSFENQKNIYGVAEESSVIETIDFAKTCNPNLSKIIYFVEDTITGKLETIRIKDKLKIYNNIEMVDISNLNFLDILDYIKNNDDKNAIILIPFYVKDVDGNEYTNKEVIEAVSEVSNIPIYGLYSFQFGHGIIGGKIVDPYSQGYEAVLIMEDYFNGDINKSFLYKSIETNKYKIDYKEIKKFDFENVKLPSDSIVINKPKGFFEENVIYIATIVSLLFLAIIYVALLKKQINKKTEKINNYYKTILDKEKEVMEYRKLAGLGEIIIGIAHEINTPLGSSMTGMDYFLKTNNEIKNKIEHNNMTKKEILNYLEKINNSGDLIMKNLNIVSDLIDEFKMINSSIENNNKNVKISSLIDEMISLYEKKLNDKKVLLFYNCDENIELYTDKNKMKNIFSALIDNSLQHGFRSDINGIIRIDVRKYEDVFYIEYFDDGIGIEKKLLKKVFEPFYSDKKNSNKGLGLYYVYNAVKSLGGRIEVKSKKGEGTKFIIELYR